VIGARKKRTNMATDDVRDLLEQNGLAETIAMLHEAAQDSFGPGDAEAHAKMTLILRVLGLSPDATAEVLRLIEKLAN